MIFTNNEELRINKFGVFFTPGRNTSQIEYTGDTIKSENTNFKFSMGFSHRPQKVWVKK